MIAVDTSAFVAVVLGEPELEHYSSLLHSEPTVAASTSIFESAIVLQARQGAVAVEGLRSVLHHSRTEIVPVDTDLAWTAHTAWQRFGRGRHPAALNFGDCLSYALAKSLDVPLLFKGDDFTQTDLAVAR